MPTLSLRQRILWWSVASTLTVLLAAFLFVDTVFRSTILEDQRENVLAGTRLLQQLQQSEVEELRDLTASLSVTPTLRAAVETRDPATIRQNLDALVGGTPAAWLAVTTPEGEPLAATASAPVERIAGARSLVAQARFYDTGDLWLRDGRLEQVFASTIFFGSTRLGILFSGVPIGPDRVTRLSSATRQRIAFVADDRVVAGGMGLGEEGTAELVEAWSPAARPGAVADGGGATMPVREFSIMGDRFIGAAIPLPDASGETRARLVGFRSLDEAMRPADTLRLALMGIALIGILLAFAASSLVARRVTRPVNRLLRETVRIGSGDLDRPIEAERPDEVGLLARGFDQMRVSLREAREELVRAERLSAVGRAASAIVHDFRQPVTVIRGYLDLLEDSVDDEAQRRKDVGVIRAEVTRMTEMMGEVLDFARGGEGSLLTSIGSVPELLEEVAAGARAAVPDKEVDVEVEHGYDGNWKMDFAKTRRALGNLATNAAEAVPAGGRVRLGSERTPRGLRLTVEDDGPGIPPEIRDTLFDPFVTRGKAEGTGLGLAIAKAFVERQGGTVRLDTSDRGTRFTLEFPASDAPEGGPA